VAEPEAAIERLAAAPTDDGLVLQDIWLLRLRAFLARPHGDAAAYPACQDDPKAKVKVSAELRLLEASIARLLKQISTEPPSPRSLRSEKAARAFAPDGRGRAMAKLQADWLMAGYVWAACMRLCCGVNVITNWSMSVSSRSIRSTTTPTISSCSTTSSWGGR
jgi:hypothetical protein